jgi:hypothetical protein
MPSHGDPDDVRIAWMDDHASERLRIFEADVRERFARVGALVQPVSVRRRLPVVRFAGGDVEDVRVGGRERQIGDRSGSVGVENRFEGDAVVHRLDHASDGKSDVIGRRVLLVHRDVVDSAALRERSDGAPSEAAQERVVRLVDRGRRGRVTAAALGDDRRRRRREQSAAQGDVRTARQLAHGSSFAYGSTRLRKGQPVSTS